MFYKNKILRNVSSNYAGFIIDTLVTLLLMPLLICKLGATTFGMWILLNTLLAYSRLLEMGTSPAIIRYVSLYNARNEKNETESIIGSALFLMILLSVITVPITYAVAVFGPSIFNLPEADKAIFNIASWLVGATGIVAYFRRLFLAVLEGYQRYDLINLYSIPGRIISVVFMIYFVAQGYGIITLIIILLLETIYGAVFEIIILKKLFKLRITPFNSRREEIKRILEYSFYAFLIDVAVNISHRIDTVIISIFLPISTVTFYEIGKKIAGFLERFTEPLIETFFPLASEIHTSSNTELLRRLFVEGTRISILMIAPGVILGYRYGANIIGWWVGESYVAPSVMVLYIFLGLIFIRVFDSTASGILLGTGIVRFEALVSLATAAMTVILSLILVKKFGVAGVALGYLISIIIFNIFVSMPYVCSLTCTSVFELYFTVFSPLLIITSISLIFIIMTSTLITNQIFSCVVDCLFVSATTLIVFFKTSYAGINELLRFSARNSFKPYSQ